MITLWQPQVVIIGDCCFKTDRPMASMCCCGELCEVLKATRTPCGRAGPGILCACERVSSQAWSDSLLINPTTLRALSEAMTSEYERQPADFKKTLCLFGRTVYWATGCLKEQRWS